jgi:hypothetical protein
MRFLILAVLAGCNPAYYAARAEGRRYEREYDFDKPSTMSAGHVRVHPPTWAPGVGERLAAAVDATVTRLRAVPGCETFDFGRVIVWVHENPGRFVSPGGVWSTGARTGNRVVVSLIERADGFVLHSLAHELLHVAGFIHPGGKYPEDLERACRESRVPVGLTAEEKARALAYTYSPWRTP